MENIPKCCGTYMNSLFVWPTYNIISRIPKLPAAFLPFTCDDTNCTSHSWGTFAREQSISCCRIDSNTNSLIGLTTSSTSVKWCHQCWSWEAVLTRDIILTMYKCNSEYTQLLQPVYLQTGLSTAVVCHTKSSGYKACYWFDKLKLLIVACNKQTRTEWLECD